MPRKKIQQGERVEIKLSPRERELILRHTLADPELTRPLTRSKVAKRLHRVRYTLDDLAELLGYVAAEANHSTDKKVQRELSALFGRLQKVMQSYDDGMWQEPF